MELPGSIGFVQNCASESGAASSRTASRNSSSSATNAERVRVTRSVLIAGSPGRSGYLLFSLRDGKPGRNRNPAFTELARRVKIFTILGSPTGGLCQLHKEEA